MPRPPRRRYPPRPTARLWGCAERLRHVAVVSLMVALASGIASALVEPPATARTGPTGRPALWFYPLDDTYRGFLRRSVSPDYMQLFRPGSPWTGVLANLNVFVIGAPVPLNKPLAEQRRMFAFLRTRHVGLALQTQGLQPVPGCGAGQEAYRSLGEFVAALTRIRDAGGELSYVSLDEPLWFAHSYEGANACRRPIEELARGVADRLRAARAIFPRVAFGDIEPINVFKPAELRPTIAAWFDAYRLAAGEPFAYFQADLDWNRPQKDAVLRIGDLSREKGIPFGVIFTGNYKTGTDLEWARQCVSRAHEMELLQPLHQSVFESWMIHPEHVLPESDPSSFTGLIHYYLSDRSP